MRCRMRLHGLSRYPKSSRATRSVPLLQKTFPREARGTRKANSNQLLVAHGRFHSSQILAHRVDQLLFWDTQLRGAVLGAAQPLILIVQLNRAGEAVCLCNGEKASKIDHALPDGAPVGNPGIFGTEPLVEGVVVGIPAFILLPGKVF